MTSIANLWRTKHQRYRLQGAVCLDCGQVSFPPRVHCLACPPPSAFVYDDEITLGSGGDEILVDRLLEVNAEPPEDQWLSGCVATLATEALVC